MRNRRLIWFGIVNESMSMFASVKLLLTMSEMWLNRENWELVASRESEENMSLIAVILNFILKSSSLVVFYLLQ